MAFPYPLIPTEFEIQASLFWELRSLGYNVRGEVESMPVIGRVCCRPDLILFNKVGAPMALVECKNGHKRRIPEYRSFGFPVFQCLGMPHIPFVVSAIRSEVEP